MDTKRDNTAEFEPRLKAELVAMSCALALFSLQAIAPDFLSLRDSSFITPNPNRMFVETD
jgi:hypothetical protein